MEGRERWDAGCILEWQRVVHEFSDPGQLRMAEAWRMGVSLTGDFGKLG